jgi:hypothetical protein
MEKEIYLDINLDPLTMSREEFTEWSERSRQMTYESPENMTPDGSISVHINVTPHIPNWWGRDPKCTAEVFEALVKRWPIFGITVTVHQVLLVVGLTKNQTEDRKMSEFYAIKAEAAQLIAEICQPYITKAKEG